ncbi:MAG TPA: PRC-barrel domain-containing protein [Prolixibacteraceae bacterium]|nr:PRC-barrel domain-containing protein [Prolixibacteraceae bacterium]
MLFKSKSIRNYKLLCTDGEFGRVKEFLFDDLHWTVRYLVADTGNWLTGKLVLISPYALLHVDNDAEHISTNLSKDQIKNSPPLESHLPVSRQYESSYHDYYGYPQYWAGSMMWGALPHISRDSNDWKKSSERVNTEDSHLRSAKDVNGYSIEANDGEIGHLDDFIIDDETWAIRYLEINTKSWGTGKKVLISPKWIDHVGWEVSEIYVAMSREAVRQSPEYEDDMIISRDYETKLHSYYDRSGYWVSEPEESHHQV